MNTAKEVANDLYWIYLDEREQSKTIQDVGKAWEKYNKSLDEADIIATLAGYEYRDDIKNKSYILNQGEPDGN